MNGPIAPITSPPAPLGPDDPSLRELAGTPVLLVACDFDGTLSPMVPRPQDARAEEAALSALARLSRLPRTYTAIISGRDMADLRRMLGEAPGIHLVGSHGVESDFWTNELTADERERVLVLRAEARRIADANPNALAEEKRFGAAVHYRRCAPDDAARVARETLDGPARLPGVHALEGHAVVELSVRPHNKGGALAAMRYRLGATRVVFIGDDKTDETAFATMPTGDLSIKIGDGPTTAARRIGSQSEVAGLLASLADHRGAELDRENWPAITSHALLSDQRTVALVNDRGEVNWMCLPSADSSAVFASLLGDQGGRFRIAPARGSAPHTAPGIQAYIPDSMIVRTSWDGVTLTDYLDCTGGRAYQRPGRSDLMRVLEGTGECEACFEPRPDFGRGRVTLTPIDAGLIIEAGAELGVLLSPAVAWSIRPTANGHAADAVIRLTGQPVVFELRWGQGGTAPFPLTEPQRRQQTERFWSGWASSLALPKVAPDAVRRSALVIKSLCHGPSGGILAAATTSLPEQLGGVRNWDYRFCWPRDACMSARALVRLGNTGVAMKLLDWLVEVVATAPSPDRIRPIYTVAGGSLSPEAEINGLSGYHRSSPVRIGNAADNQVQLDVFGPIVDLVASVAERGTPVTPEHWRLVQSMVDAVESRWNEPDHGIWEIRGPRRRHVHSAVMCWVAATRGAQVARDVVGRPRPAWEALADEIRTDVLEHGFNARVGAFTSAYDSDQLDAAALWVVMSGMIAPDDPRAVGTVRAVQAGLARGPVVDRYRYDDGIPGLEGGFLITAYWLAESLRLIGDAEGAQRQFDLTTALASRTGLLAEQHDPGVDLPLGNYPQAYSHLGLINAACRLSGA